MNIKVAMLSGINRVDTPMFDTLVEQQQFFSGAPNLIEIETTYYPPHYTNKIRISVEDIDFTESVNYLWFDFRGKTYYYFIDDITYISENLIELDTTMDYIQTYMFDIYITNGIIERKFINRWKRMLSGWIINREYLRENVSDGLYEKGTKHIFNNPDYVLIVKAAKRVGNQVTSNIPELQTLPEKVTSIFETYDNEIVSPYRYYFCFSDEIDTIQVNGRTYNNYAGTVYNMLSDPNVVDAYLLPTYLFTDLFDYLPDQNTVILKEYNGMKPHLCSVTILMPILTAYCAVEWGVSNIDIDIDYNKFPIFKYTKVISSGGSDGSFYNALQFERNINTGVDYSSKYLPIMLDENYMYEQFGNKSNNIDYPEHYRTSMNIKFTVVGNITDGTLVFYNNETYNNDTYDIAIIDSNVVSQELINDPWKEYVANNKNRWASAGLQVGLNVFDTALSIATHTAFAKKGMNRILQDRRSYTKKKGKFKVGASSRITKIQDDLAKSNIEDIGGLVGGIASPLISQGIADANKQQAPFSSKQIGNFTSLYSYDKDIYYRLFKVRDYEQCAWYFHLNGYHVEEHIVDNDNIFAYVKNRYYFNVLKMSDVQLFLTNAISDNNTVEGITERLRDGLRLWNVKPEGTIYYGYYEYAQYDNVELDYLS